MFFYCERLKMDNALVSIIIPAYNVESYIEDCLNSIINQTYKDLDIIVINDGSTDKTVEKIQGFLHTDKRITLINQENKGLSSVRNLGLQLVAGDYVMYVDSDDWLDLDTVENCVNRIIETQADVCFFSYLSEFKGRSEERTLFTSDKLFEKEECIELQRRLLGPMDQELCIPQRLDSYGSFAMKLYRKDLLKGMVFTDTTLIGTAEDVLFNVEFFLRVKRAVYINKPFYHYRKTVSTSLTSIYRPRLLTQWCCLFDLMSQFAISERAKKALNNRIAISLFGLGITFCDAPISLKERLKKIKECLYNPLYEKAFLQLNFSYFPLHWKLFYYCGKHKFVFGVFLLSKFIQLIRKR